MGFRSIISFILFIILVGLGIANGGNFSSFIDIPSVLITLGGGLLLSLINFPIGDLFGAIGKGFGTSDLEAVDGLKAQRTLKALGYYLLGAGVLGTIIGLINMGQALNDPSAAWPGVATALITTCYGVVLVIAIIIPLRWSVINRTKVS